MSRLLYGRAADGSSVLRAGAASLMILTLSACAAIQKPAEVSSAAELTPASPSTIDLVQLPPPQKKIVAAVYGFRDETGQYKPAPDSSFSTAVTQGAASLLMKSLRDSGWYIPVEREGLQSLLTERRVLRALNENGNQAVHIPNLMPATIILEGGIVAYDTNTRTGGLGAQFLGIGLSTRYSVDQVTINLRAVDVMTGAVMNSVSTTKTIYSHEIHPSYFRFVNYYDLLEIEAGYTRNEPAQLAVKEAIDAAVAHLTVQGIRDNLWSLRNPDDWNSPLIQRYLRIADNYAVTTERRSVDAAAGPVTAPVARVEGSERL